MALNNNKETKKRKLEEAQTTEVLSSAKADINSITMLDQNEAGPSHPEKKSRIDIGLEVSEAALMMKNSNFENNGSCVREDIQDAMAALPPEVNIMKFVEARASEIAFLTEAVMLKTQKQVYQQLPNHLRRRAASHNPKRLPRRLRRKAMKELQKVKKTKRPSRKYRRRPSNLLLEYNRRQRTHVWLETHIWFAKRFKMTELWGYKLPLHPTDKSERAAYRASMNYALMQDISYYGCIELAGNEEVLLQLGELTSPETGLTFQAKLYLSGTREGVTMLYHRNSYPYGFIGPVKFLWKAQVINITEQDNNMRQLWLWVHPSCYNEVVDELISLFQLEKIKSCRDDILVDSKLNKNTDSKNTCIEAPVNKNKCKQMDKSAKVDIPLGSVLDTKRNMYFERISSYTGNGIKMVLLKDVLVRHHLIGPHSFSIIANAVKLFAFDSLPVTQGDKGRMECKWWQKAFTTHTHGLLQKKKNIWEALQVESSVSCMPPGTAIGLTVLDPRITLPSKKSKVENAYKGNYESTEHNGILPSPELAHSFIWNSAIRDEVSCTKISEAALNKMRSDNLVPGSSLTLGDEESRIPILVIQQPGNNEGYAGGWDIIAPAGWSMAFWLAFLYRGARTYGLRESRSVGLESGQPVFPNDFPDSQSGEGFSEKERVELITKHYKYPPDKRPSFKKLGIVTPFFNPWFQLINEWKEYGAKNMNLNYQIDKNNDTSSEDTSSNSYNERKYFVVRNKRCLKKISNIPNEQVKDGLSALSSTLMNGLCKTNLNNSLICIRLVCLFKGFPGKFSSICLPLEADLEQLKQNPHYGGPSEPVHKFKKETKSKSKKKKSKEPENKKTQDTKNENLKKPELIDLLSSCTRKIFGYVESGGFSFHRGHGCGIGSSLTLGDEESRIPILVIQQPGNNEGYAGGWDIIAPAGWSMAFWLAFLYRGARTYGLRESRSVGLESGQPVFPNDFPDSQSGEGFSEKERVELITKHYKYPPDKRPSFKKLGIVTPFFNPWFQLINEWKEYGAKNMNLNYQIDKNNDTSSEDTSSNSYNERKYFVVRNKRCLKKISNIPNEQVKDGLSALSSTLMNGLCKTNLNNSLICIRLVCLFKGFPGKFSSICLPLEADLEQLKQNPHYGGPSEPVHKFKKETKSKSKKKKSKEPENKKTQDTKNENLKKPELIDLLSSCTRKIFGYVESGGFSFHRGHGCGIGHCTFIGLLETFRLSFIANDSKPLVLIKKQNCFQYRFCTIEIVT